MYICICIYIHIYIVVYTCRCIYVYVYVYIYIYILLYIHIDVYMYILSRLIGHRQICLYNRLQYEQICRDFFQSDKRPPLPSCSQTVVCCSVSQCVAVCCSVLQCVAVCFSVLQGVAVYCGLWQCVTVRCSVFKFWLRAKKPYTNKALFQKRRAIWAAIFDEGHRPYCNRAAVCCRVLQSVAECCSVLQCVASVLQRVAVSCSVLQCRLKPCCRRTALVPSRRIWQTFSKVSPLLKVSSAAKYCSALQWIAVHCSVLQCIAVCCSVFSYFNIEDSSGITSKDVEDALKSQLATQSHCILVIEGTWSNIQCLQQRG